MHTQEQGTLCSNGSLAPSSSSGNLLRCVSSRVSAVRVVDGVLSALFNFCEVPVGLAVSIGRLLSILVSSLFSSLSLASTPKSADLDRTWMESLLLGLFDFSSYY